MHIVGDGALPHIRDNSHLVVGYALQRHESLYGPRAIVRLGVKELAWLTHKIASLQDPIPDSARGRLIVLFQAAAERQDALPGWRIELDRSARRPRLRCTRILAPAGSAGAAAPA